MRILLYSHYSETGAVDEYVLRSLANIEHNFHHVYFLTNLDTVNGIGDNVTPVTFESRIDFEAYADFFRRHADIIASARRIYLVNDSVLLQAPVHLPSSSMIDAFGLVQSRQHGMHIQSFCIGFHNRRTIDRAVAYLLAYDGDYDDKESVIQYCEVGLSLHLAGQGHRLAASFTAPADCDDNPTLVYWHSLLRETGLLKRNHVLGSGDYGAYGVQLAELQRACRDETWARIVSRLYVPRPPRQGPDGPAEDLLDEVYRRILMRRCDPSGRQTYTGFLAEHSLRELENVLRASDEYHAIVNVATAYREVLGRYPDPQGLRAYRADALREDGVGRIAEALRASPEYRQQREGARQFRALCRQHAHRHRDFRATLRRDGRVEAVLIETRREEALRYVVPQVVRHLPAGYGLTIFHGVDNAGFLRDTCRNIEGVRFIALPASMDLADFRQYNALLTDAAFWERFRCHSVLLFQWDCLLNADGVDAFVGYDYVGAPWQDGRVGNGGFSLRNVAVMRELAGRGVRGDFENEDQFFSRMLYRGDYRLPAADTASMFCSERRQPSLAFHRPWLACQEEELEALFPAGHADANRPRVTTTEGLVPVALIVDVEPDPRLPDRADDWRGFEQLHDALDAWRVRLTRATARPVHYAWMLRADAQVAAVHGGADFVFRRYARRLDALRRVGDALGVHVHGWRRQDDGWLADYEDEAWTIAQLRTAQRVFHEALGETPGICSIGDRYMSPALMAAIDELGFAVDLTLQPNRPATAVLAAGEQARGSLPDFEGVPRHPYRPSRADYRREGDPAHAVIEVPLSTGGDNPVEGLLLGRDFGPVRDIIEENLAAPRPWLCIAVRSDVLLDAHNRACFQQAMDYLEHHPLRHRFVFEQPQALARRMLEPA